MLDYFRNTILIIFLFNVSMVCVAQAYRWIDADGNVQFGDRPPAEASTQTIDIKQQKSHVQEAEPLVHDENLSKAKDHCGELITEKQSHKKIMVHNILGKWQFHAQSKCLDKEVQPSGAFKYNWEFKTATSVEMSLGRTKNSASYKLVNNVIYMDNLAKTTMVLIRQEPQQLVWAHLLGNSFEGYFYVRRN